MEMNFVGIGFEAYFNPLFPNFFKCTYTDAWTGRPTCGGRGKTGINCYNTYNGSPGRSPHGGQGCKFRRDRQRWNHPMEYYMANTNADTYMYNCNGPQHSSGFNMNHRWWIPSAKASADEYNAARYTRTRPGH